MSAQIFIDAENVKPEIGFKAIEKFSGKYQVEQVDIIGNETTISSKYLEASNRYNIKNCFYGKNSADTWLCTEIAKTIFEKPHVDTIIIISSDRDFLAAIKLVTDQKRKVIFVSDGNGHRNLKAMFYDLRINPDFVELVDFKTELAISPPVKNKVIFNYFKIIPQNLTADEVKRLIKKRLPIHLKTFYQRNEKQFKFIKLKYSGGFIEVPFFAGINLSTFTNFLIGLKIIPNGKVIPQILEDNQLFLYENKLYLDMVESIEFEKFESEDIEKQTVEPEIVESAENPFNEVINYFVEHAAETKNIFIKFDGSLHEVPFINGMSLEMFSELLKGYEITDDSDKIKKIIAESFLNLIDDKIYFHDEEKISDELRAYLKIIPPETLNVMMKNENKLKIVSIAHNEQVNKVPFVEGMHLSAFVYMLRHLNIFSKNSASVEILTGNGFTIRNNLIYFQNCPISKDKKISSEFEKYLKNIPSDAQTFMLKNEENLKLVSIAHNNLVHKVPFVEGMNFSTFVHMLRHLGVFGKNASSHKILTANGFTVRDNLVFKKSVR